jgi:hypothetical protein
MADGSNEEETRSQGTRQSTRDEGSNGSYKGGACRGNRNNKNSLQGNIAELGNNVTNMELKIKVIGSPERQRQ